MYSLTPNASGDKKLDDPNIKKYRVILDQDIRPLAEPLNSPLMVSR